MPEPSPPVPGHSTAQDQVALELASSCHRLKQILIDLIELHAQIDQPEQITDRDLTALRLRKAYHHIRAVIGWPVDTLILHAMGPDIRAAQSHLYPIVSQYLHESNGGNEPATARGNLEFSRTLLEAFSHPSPQVLIRRRHQGGLAPGYIIECLATLAILLAELTDNYCTALGALAQELGNGDSAALLEVFQRIGNEIDSIPIADDLEALTGKDTVP